MSSNMLKTRKLIIMILQYRGLTSFKYEVYQQQKQMEIISKIPKILPPPPLSIYYQIYFHTDLPNVEPPPFPPPSQSDRNQPTPHSKFLTLLVLFRLCPFLPPPPTSPISSQISLLTPTFATLFTPLFILNLFPPTSPSLPPTSLPHAPFS